MKLRIVTPTRMLVDAEVSELTAPGLAGEFGVLSEHVAFLGALESGILRYTEDGTVRSLAVDGGYCEVSDDIVTVLADEASFADEIDAEQARTELASIDAEIDAPRDDPAEIDELIRRRRYAEARAEVSS